MKEVSSGLQRVLVAELVKHHASINDVSTLSSIIKPTELEETGRNVQQNKARLALEIFQLSKHS